MYLSTTVQIFQAKKKNTRNAYLNYYWALFRRIKKQEKIYSLQHNPIFPVEDNGSLLFSDLVLSVYKNHSIHQIRNDVQVAEVSIFLVMKKKKKEK